jgi:hypothetical protein
VKNIHILSSEISFIKKLPDYDFRMLLSEIHDHGWPMGRKLLPLMKDAPHIKEYIESQPVNELGASCFERTLREYVGAVGVPTARIPLLVIATKVMEAVSDAADDGSDQEIKNLVANLTTLIQQYAS